MHLRVADPFADLALRQVVHEAQLEHLPLDLGECQPRARDRVAILDQLVGRVLAPKHLNERGGLAVIARGRCVE
jgi:hypothetical protein